jgi:hypothetical protein
MRGGNGVEDSGCSDRARAKHRGQCSICIEGKRTLIERPQREQFKYISQCSFTGT